MEDMLTNIDMEEEEKQNIRRSLGWLMMMMWKIRSGQGPGDWVGRSAVVWLLLCVLG